MLPFFELAGRFAFAFMLLPGLLVLWVYGILSRIIDMTPLSRIQDLISDAVFIDPESLCD